MYWKIIKQCLTTFITNVFLTLCIAFVICGIILTCTNNKKTSTPVEDIVIDSIKYENNKITIEINNLESIKNAEIIEIKNLNNDSTLKLFYELIRKQ